MADVWLINRRCCEVRIVVALYATFRQNRVVESVLAAIDKVGLVELASALARFPSHIPDEGELGRALADIVRGLGCFDEVRLQPVVPGRSM